MGGQQSRPSKQINVCRDYLGWIDKVKENRSITALEKWVACIIKKRFTKLSIMQEDTNHHME